MCLNFAIQFHCPGGTYCPLSHCSENEEKPRWTFLKDYPEIAAVLHRNKPRSFLIWFTPAKPSNLLSHIDAKKKIKFVLPIFSHLVNNKNICSLSIFRCGCPNLFPFEPILPVLQCIFLFNQCFFLFENLFRMRGERKIKEREKIKNGKERMASFCIKILSRLWIDLYSLKKVIIIENMEKSKTGQIEHQILRRFHLLKKIGSGAYGHVWKVQDRADKKIYALKKIFGAFQSATDAQRTYR